MIQLLFDGALLAAQDPLENLAREFQGRETRLNSGYLTTGLLILLAILLGVWVLSQIVERYGERRPTDSAPRLFLELCRAHRLRWRESWLLWRVAREQRLVDPARLFVESWRIDPVNVSPLLRTQAQALEAIRRRLFADEMEDDPRDVPPTVDGREQTPRTPESESPGWSPLPGVPGASADLTDWPAALRPGNPPPTTSR